MRATLTGLTLAWLLLLACSREPAGLASEHEGAGAQPQQGEAQPESELSAATPAAANADAELPSARAHDPTLEQPGSSSTPEHAAASGGETGAGEAKPPGEAPADPLAPESGTPEPGTPEPGTPEADAELAELLEESTITQEEFDRAFRGGGPKIEGDRFVLDRTTAQ